MYGHNNVSISSGDRVSTVINHALWFWPHQGISTQEMEDLNGTTQRLSSTVGGWCPGLVAPERMHGPGLKELPDVCPSGAPNEFANSRADASIERSMNKRGRGLRWKEEGGH